ncbi:tRNA (adenosine(37)-N6)-dimethylallyltransferase MiaA [uncultured Veillonella sp.]|uniref:tRNA (adenosine(37)-N6)-dimethylallyltransferase MiaA n=1 Tax=uncultured Veillonella sp. TaxID=159268 RepID=UPI0025ECDA5D|nr:tRNA (adenosine(37)-N6)-dimethylallyltransferase MiaA [uncultured Veillonella sp.]
MNPLITIVGPTAVGKTDLTLELAEQLNAEVISGDAYQVYKQLNIGTAKPSMDELNRVKHHLIDILEPNDSYSVSIFQDQAKEIIVSLKDQNILPILSGGTGLYVQSLLENYNFNDVKPDENLRAKLDELYNTKGIEGLRDYAFTLGKEHNIEIQYNDKHRLYRAIEILHHGDVDSLRNQTKDGVSYKGPVIGLMRDRDKLYERINLRVDMMFYIGLIEEVEQLLKSGVNPDCQAFKGIGYKEVVEYINGRITLDECRDLIKKNTRHFAKRQITWYKRMPYIEWIHIDNDTSKDFIFNKAMDLIRREGLA